MQCSWALVWCSLQGESFITTHTKAKLADATIYLGLQARELDKIKVCGSKSNSMLLKHRTIETKVDAKKANASGLIFVASVTRQVAVDIIPQSMSTLSRGLKSSTTLLNLPRVNILATWAPQTSPTLTLDDKRSVSWNFPSGTLMSCPHVSGVVALIKSAHPNWSPAVIRSILITTANTRDTSFDSILADGSTKASIPLTLVPATLIDPIKPMDPGLVYDMKTSEYVLFLCNIGYTGDQINQIFFALPELTHAVHKYQLQIFSINYPSITVSNFQSPIHRDDQKKRPQRGEN